jgi:hypothetical protein
MGRVLVRPFSGMVFSGWRIGSEVVEEFEVFRRVLLVEDGSRSGSG